MSVRIWVGSVALLGLALPCGGNLANLRPDHVSLSDVNRAARIATKSAAGIARCDALKDKPVVFEEERAIGGAVAVAFANQAERHLMLDVPPGTAEDLAALKPADVPVPSGEKQALNRYLNRVGQNLAALSARPTLNWTFAVLDDPAPNAFSAPGGYVLITRGLLRKLENEAQLAAVLAHEIGHVTERHALKLYSEVKVSQCRTAVAIDVGSAVGAALELNKAFEGLLGSGSGVLDVDNLSRQAIVKITDSALDRIKSGNAADDEFVADRVAIELAVAAGYNPHEYTRLIQKQPDSSGLFANHPKNAARIAKLQERIAVFRPSPDSFSNHDWPFEKYPKVAFKDELKAAR